jgi:CheY-like chemotaxis protein
VAKILIVDDNPDERRIMATALYYNGFETVEAAAGMEAVSLAREAQPDLILMDIKLPDMNGFLAAEIIHAEASPRTVPIVCLTGLDISPEAARERGCTELLTKPIEPREVVNAVHRNLVQPPAA